MQSNSENHPEQTSKRRSTRIAQAVPLVVTGVDALGRPFQERTSTQSINSHGGRYQSKHYVLKNMWVTLEVPNPQTGQPPRKVRGRVTWIQRPRTVRELFQVAVELETPGNLWGLAFHPPDWTPFPENASADESAMETNFMSEHEAQQEITHGDIRAGETESGETTPPDNLRVFPMTGGDPAVLLARQMARLMMEAKQQIQAAALEATSKAATEEARRVLDSIEKQLQGAVQVVANANAEQLTRETLERVRHESEEELGALRERWNAEIEERLTQIEREHASAFAQQLESYVDGATEQASARNAELAATEARIEESLRQLSQELAQNSTTDARRIQSLAEEKAQQIRAHADELEQSVERERVAFAADADQAHEKWHAQLEAERASAAASWQDTLARSMEEAAQRAAERLAEHALSAGTHFDQEIALRISVQRQALEQVATQAQGSLERLRELVERESARSRDLQEQLQQTSRRIDGQTANLDALSRATQAQLEEQFANLLEQGSAELRTRAEATVSEMTERLGPMVESAGQETLQRLARQLEDELGPRIDLAKQMIEELTSGREGAEATLRELEQHLRESSAAMERESAERLGATSARIEGELDEKGGAAIGKWLAELESKATETAHTTFEGLMKAAAWYEKKIQTQMQGTLDKGIETAETQLREKAGEISGIFATEMDHHSRNFVEHVQGQVGETLSETLEKARAEAQGLAGGALAEFQGEMRATLQREHERFTGALDGLLEDYRTRTDSIRTHAESTLITDATRRATDFRQALDEEMNEGVTRARRNLEAELAPLIEHWNQHRAHQEKQFSSALDQLGETAIGSYKDRLENVANTFLVTTAASLNQRGQETADRLIEDSEQRLQSAVVRVFAGVGETLRQRLLDISASVVPEAAAAENSNAGRAATGGLQP